MRTRTVFCECCGKPFDSDNPKAKYCSAECRKIFWDEEKRIRAQKRNAYRRKHPEAKPSTMPSLIDIANQAVQSGLSYGQYVASLER